MDFLRKIAGMLATYYDKLVLGALLSGLAVVMVQQSCSMQQTIAEVVQARKPTDPPTGVLPPIDESQFQAQIQVNPEKLWRPIPRVVRDDPFNISKIAFALRSYLRDYGETSLFDPAVYVYSSHKQDMLVHYDTRINWVTGAHELDPTRVKPRTGDDDDNNDDKQPADPSQPLASMLRYGGFAQPSLRLVLRHVTVNNRNDKSTWLIQFDALQETGGKRSVFKRLGDEVEIPGIQGTFKVRDVDYNERMDRNNIPQEFSSVTLQQGNEGERIVLPRNQTVAYGDPVYRIVILPPLQPRQRPSAIVARHDTPFLVSVQTLSGPRQEWYKIVGRDDRENVLQARRCNQAGQALDETVHSIRQFRREQLLRYRQPTETTPPDTPGMEPMPPG